VLAGGAAEAPAASEISHRGIVAHGLRTSRDKYIRRFSPETDELYFDLAKDPKELTSVLGTNPERERLLRAGVEDTFVPNPFRYVIRATGASAIVLALETAGFVMAPTAAGLGPDEGLETANGGHRLELRLRPREGAPREVAFGLRPRGAPVTLAGSVDGRPLRPADVSLGQAGFAPPDVPFTLPQLEAEDGQGARGNLFAAAAGEKRGLRVWLVLDKDKSVMAMDKETCEKMMALGYIGSCAGF
jgi:hypothetical protein